VYEFEILILNIIFVIKKYSFFIVINIQCPLLFFLSYTILIIFFSLFHVYFYSNFRKVAFELAIKLTGIYAYAGLRVQNSLINYLSKWVTSVINNNI